MIKGIAHVAYTVSDMEKSLHFYCDQLGFEKAFEIRDDEGKPWINYIKVGKNQFIELFYGGKKKEHSQNEAGFSHLCFEVDDIQKVAEELKKKNVIIDVDPKQGKDFNWQCWIKDPDGNRIELMEISDKSPQYKASR
ncbi:VOC family protein [Athalassotoga saccharophila]|uniref:VOC family protein n=1 Tax=Athalassotoga saccharophila TaxID=1441386 RepID=UPI00137ABDE4|nr:VOC family protein [Athalassotoga saccharophila]BBJ28387.1 lactoylglutathione lyase [Athalassotoga saccharophila]